MKKLILSTALIFIAVMQMKAQSPYISMPDATAAGGFIYNGIITKYALINQPAFNWYGSSQAGYTAPANVVAAMTAAKDKVTYMVFGGTWCSDTQFILPKFFKLQEASGTPDANISLIGVDRQKHSVGNMASTFGITNVPTIIVLKNGKETGRIVEYGTTGKWDEELAGLLK